MRWSGWLATRPETETETESLQHVAKNSTMCKLSVPGGKNALATPGCRVLEGRRNPKHFQPRNACLV